MNRTKQLTLFGDVVPEEKDRPPKKRKITKEEKVERVEIPNLDFREDFLEHELLEETKAHFMGPNAQWLSDEENQVLVYGKWMIVPRSQQMYAFDNLNVTYSFSGATISAIKTDVPPCLLKIRQYLYEKTGQWYNAVFVNKYRDGQQTIGWHRDDEKDLANGSPIGSLSIGQGRDFIFRRYKQPQVPKHKVHLKDNDLCVMHYPTNRDWEHSLPKRALSSAPGARVNFTFRRMIVE
jgi:alkylated DNA repair dioxygenase AlkB